MPGGMRFLSMGSRCWSPPVHIWVLPLESMPLTERQEFEGLSDGGLVPWPEVGSRMMTRLLTGVDTAGQWIIVQKGVYRYSVRQAGGLRVRAVLSEYLAVEVQWD